MNTTQRTHPTAVAVLLDDDWMLDADVRHAEQLVRSLRMQGLAQQPGDEAPEGPAIPLPLPGAAVAPAPRQPKPGSAPPPPAKNQSFSWTLISLGLAMFSCGAILLVWSVAGQRADLWPLGLPLALIGQAGLILGLVWQMDGLWQTSRSAVQTLEELDQELADVRSSARLLTAHSSGGAHVVHPAERGGPHLSRAHLSGQLGALTRASGRA